MSENMFNIRNWKDFKFKGWLLLQGTPVWLNEYQFKIAFCAACNFWYIIECPDQLNTVTPTALQWHNPITVPSNLEKQTGKTIILTNQ